MEWSTFVNIIVGLIIGWSMTVGFREMTQKKHLRDRTEAIIYIGRMIAGTILFSGSLIALVIVWSVEI